jgi:hypothetical protein
MDDQKNFCNMVVVHIEGPMHPLIYLFKTLFQVTVPSMQGPFRTEKYVKKRFHCFRGSQIVFWLGQGVDLNFTSRKRF